MISAAFCLVVHEATARASTMVTRFFMAFCLLLLSLVARRRCGGDDGLRAVDDARSDEDEQLGAVVAHALLLEEPAEHRDLREDGDLVPLLRVAAGVDAADDGGVAVADQHFGLRL